MEVKRLFVGGLFKDITEDAVRERFNKFGTVGSVELKHKYAPSVAGPGEWLKSYAFLDLHTTAQDFSKCVQVLGKTRWKGHSLRIEEAGADFLTTVKNEIAHADASDAGAPSQPHTKDDAHGTLCPPGQPAIVQSELRGATPGTAVPGVKNWVVTKFARPVPVVYIRRKDKKKVMKYDPSKYCHQLKKLEGKDSTAATASADSTSVTSLTWQLPEVSGGIYERQRRLQLASAAAVKKPATGVGGSSIASARSALTSSSRKRQQQSSGSDTGLSSDDLSDADSGGSDTSGDADATAAAAASAGAQERNSHSVASRTGPPGKPRHSVETATNADSSDGSGREGSDIEIVAGATAAAASFCRAADDLDSGDDTDDILSSQPVSKAARSPKSAPRTSGIGLVQMPARTALHSVDTEAPRASGPASLSVSATANDRKPRSLTNSVSLLRSVAADRSPAAKKPKLAAAGKPDASVPSVARVLASSAYAATAPASSATPRAEAAKAAGVGRRASTSAPAGGATAPVSAADGAPAGGASLAVPAAGDKQHGNGSPELSGFRSGDSMAPTKRPASNLAEGSSAGGQPPGLSPQKSPAVKCDRPQAGIKSKSSNDAATSSAAAADGGKAASSKLSDVKSAREAGARSAAERKAEASVAVAKHEISNQRRLETIKEKQVLAKIQQQKIKSALQSLDKDGAHKAKHITFDSDGDESGAEDGADHKVAGQELTSSDGKSLSYPLAAKKVALFESDSDSEAEVDPRSLEKAFEPKPQFEGKKGEKLMKMQARFDSDDRFRLTELFMEDRASDEGDTGKEDDAAEEDDKVDVEVSSKSEKQRNLSILRGIVGDKRVKVFDAPKPWGVASAPNMLMTRYDPTDTRHKNLELTVEPKKKKPKKSQQGDNDETGTAPPVLPPAPEVSKDRFFDVPGSLADLFAKKDGKALFSFFDDSSAAKPHASGSNLAAATSSQVAQPPWLRNYPEPRDSSDEACSEDDDEEADVTALPASTPAGDSRHAMKPTESGRPITALVDTFFFAKDDPRLVEGQQFCRTLSADELREQWLQNKDELTQDYRQQRKRVLRRLRSKQGSSDAPPWRRPSFADRRRQRP